MTREEALEFIAQSVKSDVDMAKVANAIKALEQEPILDKIRADVKAKIEEEEFARSVFRREEKDTYKAEQCTGSIMAYNNVIKLIDEYKAEQEKT